MGFSWRFDIVFRYMPFLLLGIRTTILVCLSVMASGLVGGLFVVFARLSKYRVFNAVASAYTDLCNAIPPYVLIIWIHFCLPILTGLHVPAFVSGWMALTLYISPFAAEIFRAGILSIGRGQRDAALALGMTQAQAMRRIILPQATRRMLPLLGSLLISLTKDSSLVSTIQVTELTRHGLLLTTRTFRPLEVTITIAILYFLLTYPLSLCVNYLYRKGLTE